MEKLAEHKVFGGMLGYWRHESRETRTPMRFSLFLPPAAESGTVPLIWWLSGLTCTEDNFTVKAGAYGRAAALGLAIVAPDTSPRGADVPDDDAYDFGQGAGFYIDATQPPWATHFRMESYLIRELPALIADRFAIDADRQAITGHSMGGHGALTLALKYPKRFRSVSAFAPIASPSRCPWGEKAFHGYLGGARALWAKHDAALLLEAGAAQGHYDDILIDQGTNDPFLDDQLKPALLESAAAKAGQRLSLRRQAGYDHSYFFIATFIADHLDFHAARLKA
ncbi:MAG: S-formylglutathione hydrolase [Alphaproteobacteria bacterium]|nr:MAG: S-formylglutathione hydrolase [Alphaproteobacteria bacterium]